MSEKMVLQDNSYISLSSEAELYPYLISRIAKYMPAQREIKSAVTISKYFTFKITEYATKSKEYFYLIEDRIDEYKESLEKYSNNVQVMFIHDNTRFPAEVWNAMLNEIAKEFMKKTDNTASTVFYYSGFSPRLEVFEKKLNYLDFGSHVDIVANSNKHTIRWYPTSHSITVSIEDLSNEYYKEIEWKGYKRVEEC